MKTEYSRNLIQIMIDKFNKSSGRERQNLAAELDAIQHPDLLKITYADGKRGFQLSFDRGVKQRMVRLPINAQLKMMREGKKPFD